MTRIKAQSPDSKIAYTIISELQNYFVSTLNSLSNNIGTSQNFIPIEWFRENGEFGGGVRYISSDDTLFNRASVNISQVQYESDKSKSLASATALSSIIHPKNPYAPSIHMHISWTEMKNGQGYWRIMADLNPSIFNQDDKTKFDKTLSKISSKHYEEAIAQGDKYFNIPVLNSHRGVSHFYLENFHSDNKEIDSQLAKQFIKDVIDTYIEIINNQITNNQIISIDAKKEQLAYHTLYLFQVLTLDRGTTSGLLVHNQNDIGILGSLPSHINKSLLLSWKDKMPENQDILVQAIADCINNNGSIENIEKIKLANAVRTFYLNNPDSLKFQASGNISVPTIKNHK